MNLSDIKMIRLDEVIDNSDLFFAHTREDQRELLSDHLAKTLDYFKKICDEKSLHEVFKRLYDSIFTTDHFYGVYLEMIYNLPFFHDLGKLNPRFQSDKMSNQVFAGDYSVNDSTHAAYGALMYFHYYYNRIQKTQFFEDESPKNISRLYKLLLFNSGIIKSHHGVLKSLEDLVDWL